MMPLKDFKCHAKKLYPKMGNQLVETIYRGASPVLEDTSKLPEKRVKLAVRAWLRHNRTDYDNEVRLCGNLARERARKVVTILEAEFR